MRQDRVLFLNHSSELGGGELSLLEYLAGRPDNKAVVLFQDGPLLDQLRKHDIPVEILAGMDGVLTMKRSSGLGDSIRAALGGLGSIDRLARRMRWADMVYTNSQKATVIGAVAAMIARRPMIWHLHDIMTSPGFSGTARKVAIALTNRAAKLVIANSQATADAYRQIGGNKPITVIPNGIDPGKFQDQDRRHNHLRLAEELGIGNQPILGLFGRISPWKGQDVAIRALADIPDAHLVLVGGALFGQQDLLEQLKSQAVAAGLADRVHFLGFRRDIPELLSSVDIALHCSTEAEPFGRVIVEAMMAGTPVIVTRGGGATEIVTQTQSDLMVPPHDPEALAAAVNSLLENPDLTLAHARSIQAKAIELYDIAKVNQKIDDAIVSLSVG